jgi:hypothetical protein
MTKKHNCECRQDFNDFFDQVEVLLQDLYERDLIYMAEKTLLPIEELLDRTRRQMRFPFPRYKFPDADELNAEIKAIPRSAIPL